nr:MAG: putative capsid protein [Arizlama virus]
MSETTTTVYRSRAGQNRYTRPRIPFDVRRPSVRAMAAARRTIARLPYYAPMSTTSAAAPRQALAASRMGLAARGFVGAAGDFKYIDIAFANYQCDTTGSVTHISVVPQGTTVLTRLGKSCRPTSLQIRGMIQSNSAGVYNKPAVYLVWDNQPNKTLAAITDYLDTASSYSMIKRENASRFKTIRKWEFALSGNTTTPATGDEVKIIEEFVKLPKDCIITCTTADTTGAIGDVITGALLLITVGDKATGVTAANLAATMRLNFMDV